MKRIFTLVIGICMLQAGKAQTDSSKTDMKDTIRIGHITIIRNAKKGEKGKIREANIQLGRKNSERRQNNRVSTNWWIFDLGFANYDDKTNYTTATSDLFLLNKPGTTYPLGPSDFKLTTGKSVNVNVWIFMQRLSLIQRYVNLKYGLGLELNNYRYRSAISYREPGYSPYNSSTSIPHAYVIRDSISFSKNKLAADYLTVPFMLNFNTNPNNHNKGISLSLGVSAGYLYSQRNKQKSSERGKVRNKGDYDLERFKFAYVGELGLGPVRFYGSYSPKSMYQKSLDMGPYTLGFRFSNW